jgi:tetratricopeptide (TPR) repeat protein
VPILLLLAQRAGPGSPEPRPVRTNFSQLVLEPLSDEEAARIIDATFDWMPDELRNKIVSRAGGNPFFVEESIRSLVESGAVAKNEKGEWQLRERPAALEVPATLHGVVAARIDRLAPTAKETIQLASVIGQRYRFKHAVVQEVAYNTLLVRRRIELHRRVAVAYETVLGEGIKDFLPALAHHYLLGEVPEKAAEYSWKAAERATAIHAHVEALQLAEQSLELYEKLDRFNDAIKALFLVARVRRYRGENDAALSAYERALAMLEERDPKNPEVGNVIAHMAELCTRWDTKHPDLEGLVARGLAIVDGQRSRQKVLLLAAKSFLARKRPKPTDADWEEALATAKEALSIAEELGLLREVSLCLDAVGYAYGELGNFRESYAHNQRRLPIAKSLQDSDELIDTHNMIAISALVLGDFNESIEHSTAGRDLALETEKPRLGAVSLQMESLGRLLSADFAGVLATASRREQFLPTGKVHATLTLAAAAAAAMGMPEEKMYREQLIEGEASPTDIAACDFVSAYYGMRESESSYHAIRSAGYPKGLVDQTLIGPLAVLAAARWRIDDQPFVERIEAVIERTGHARGRALLTQAAGVRAMQRGELAKAEKLVFDAIQAFGTLRLDYERAVALADHARVLAALGRADHRQECDEAKAIADRLGAVALHNAVEQVAVAI